MTDGTKVAQELLDALVEMELVESRTDPDGKTLYHSTEAGAFIGKALLWMSDAEDPRLLQAVRMISESYLNPCDVEEHESNDHNVQGWLEYFNSRRDLPTCRRCGCTDDNACQDQHGNGCHWVEPDLCSACAGDGGERA